MLIRPQVNTLYLLSSLSFRTNLCSYDRSTHFLVHTSLYTRPCFYPFSSLHADTLTSHNANTTTTLHHLHLPTLIPNTSSVSLIVIFTHSLANHHTDMSSHQSCSGSDSEAREGSPEYPYEQRVVPYRVSHKYHSPLWQRTLTNTQPPFNVAQWALHPLPPREACLDPVLYAHDVEVYTGAAASAIRAFRSVARAAAAMARANFPCSTLPPAGGPTPAAVPATVTTSRTPAQEARYRAWAEALMASGSYPPSTTAQAPTPTANASSPPARRARASDRTADEAQAPADRKRFACPLCGSRYTRRWAVKNHFPKCVVDRGNPAGLRYDDHPSYHQPDSRSKRPRGAEEEEGEEAEEGEDGRRKRAKKE